jgi:DNA repair protein RadC
MDPSALKRQLMRDGHRAARTWPKRSTVRNELLTAPRLAEKDFVQGLRDVAGVSKQVATSIATSFPAGEGLADASVAVLESLGATRAQAERVRAAFAFVRMCDAACQARSAQVLRPSSAATAVIEALSRAIRHRDQEFFVVVALDARQRVIDIFGASIGTMNRVEIHPRDVFKHAIQARANSVIVAHNHPSGSIQPSDADVELTERLRRVGETLGIPVIDSLIVAPGTDKFFSFAEMGLFPTLK